MSLQINSFDAIVEEKNSRKTAWHAFELKKGVKKLHVQGLEVRHNMRAANKFVLLFSHRKENAQFAWRVGEGLCRVVWPVPTRLAL